MTEAIFCDPKSRSNVTQRSLTPTVLTRSICMQNQAVYIAVSATLSSLPARFEADDQQSNWLKPLQFL